MYIGWLAKNGHQYISIDIMFDTFINCFTCFEEINIIVYREKMYSYGQEKKTGGYSPTPHLQSACNCSLGTQIFNETEVFFQYSYLKQLLIVTDYL